MLSRIARTAGMIYDLATSALFHQHIPTPREAKEAESTRLSPSESKNEAIAAASPLEKHMLTFSNEEGYVTANSIYLSCLNDWHLPEEEAIKLAEATLQVAYYRGVPGVYMTAVGIKGSFLPKDAVGLLTHPSDTGIYRMQGGTVNEEQFKQLTDYAIKNDDNEWMISKSGMRAYLADWHKKDTRWSEENFLYKMIGNAGNQGEFDLFFMRAVSIVRDGESYITLKDLRNFYLDSAPAVSDIRSQKLPSSSSSILDKLGKSLKNIVEECPSYFPPGDLSYWQNAGCSCPATLFNSTNTTANTLSLSAAAPTAMLGLK